MLLNEIKDIPTEETLEEGKKSKKAAFRKKLAKGKMKKKNKKKAKKKRAKKSGFKMKRKDAAKKLHSIKTKISKKHPVNERADALAKFLDVDMEEVEESSYSDADFEADGGEYMVLTDDEADEKAADYIKDSLWAFNASFIQYHMDDIAVINYIGGDLTIEADPDDEDSEDYEMSVEEWFSEMSEFGSLEGWIKAMQEKAEGANDAFEKVIPDVQSLIHSAIDADGRGHFLSSYDGEENEEGKFYIYRTN